MDIFLTIPAVQRSGLPGGVREGLHQDIRLQVRGERAVDVERGNYGGAGRGGRGGSLIKWASGTWERRKKNNGKAGFISASVVCARGHI